MTFVFKHPSKYKKERVKMQNNKCTYCKKIKEDLIQFGNEDEDYETLKLCFECYLDKKKQIDPINHSENQILLDKQMNGEEV